MLISLVYIVIFLLSFYILFYSVSLIYYITRDTFYIFMFYQCRIVCTSEQNYILGIGHFMKKIVIIIISFFNRLQCEFVDE